MYDDVVVEVSSAGDAGTTVVPTTATLVVVDSGATVMGTTVVVEVVAAAWGVDDVDVEDVVATLGVDDVEVVEIVIVVLILVLVVDVLVSPAADWSWTTDAPACASLCPFPAPLPLDDVPPLGTLEQSVWTPWPARNSPINVLSYAFVPAQLAIMVVCRLSRKPMHLFEQPCAVKSELEQSVRGVL